MLNFKLEWYFGTHTKFPQKGNPRIYMSGAIQQFYIEGQDHLFFGIIKFDGSFQKKL